MALGTFDVQASLAYEFGLQSPWEQQVEAAGAVAYFLSRWFTPLLEMRFVQQTQGEADDSLLNRAQASILPGFNMDPLPGMTLAAGVEIPLTSAKAFDDAVRALVVGSSESRRQRLRRPLRRRELQSARRCGHRAGAGEPELSSVQRCTPQTAPGPSPPDPHTRPR